MSIDPVKISQVGSHLPKMEELGYKKESKWYSKTIKIKVPGDISKYRLTQVNDPEQKAYDIFCGHPAYWAPWNLPEGEKNNDGTYTINVELKIDRSYFEPIGLEGSGVRKNFGKLSTEYIKKFEEFVKDACKENPTIISAELSLSNSIYLNGPERFGIRTGTDKKEADNTPLTIEVISVPLSVVTEKNEENRALVMEIISRGGYTHVDIEKFKEKPTAEKQKYLNDLSAEATAKAVDKLYKIAINLRNTGKYTDAAYLFKIIYREFEKIFNEKIKQGKQLSNDEKQSYVNLCFAAGKTHHLKREFTKAVEYYGKGVEFIKKHAMPEDKELLDLMEKAKNGVPLQ